MLLLLMMFIVFCSLIFRYIGEQRHKPLWVGCGSMFLALGSILFTLPHFLSDFYNPEDRSSGGSDLAVCPLSNLSMGVVNPAMDTCGVGNETGN